jgi:hypothetical protein
MSRMTETSELVEKVGGFAKGRNEILKHLAGDRITQRQAIIAKCYDCMGFYADGRNDCGIESCSLYPYSPYGSKPAAKRVVSEKARAQARKNLARVHSKNAI